MTELEEYSKKNLKSEISEIQTSHRNSELNQLTVYEKAVIYKYSNDGFESINEILRKSKGKKVNDFGSYLNYSLNKLKNFDGLVYRGANLSKRELNKYMNAFKNNSLITEYSFISTSKSRLIAMSFKGNVLFRMFSRTGKDIEKITKFGISGYSNEKEVLFRSNRMFRILDITNESTYKLITVEEVL